MPDGVEGRGAEGERSREGVVTMALALARSRGAEPFCVHQDFVFTRVDHRAFGPTTVDENVGEQ
jgi:hypothetical protein